MATLTKYELVQEGILPHPLRASMVHLFCPAIHIAPQLYARLPAKVKPMYNAVPTLIPGLDLMRHTLAEVTAK